MNPLNVSDSCIDETDVEHHSIDPDAHLATLPLSPSRSRLPSVAHAAHRSRTDRMYTFLAPKLPAKLRAALTWVYGANARPLDEPRSWLCLGRIKKDIDPERAWIRLSRRAGSPVLLGVLIAAYIVALSFFARAQWYQTPSDDFAQCTSSYWAANDQCGLDGSACFVNSTAALSSPLTSNNYTASPFASSEPVQFRCPASCPSVILANIRAVGAEEVVYKPLVVGGGDSAATDNGGEGGALRGGTYRGDSWLCVAAVHAGVMTSSRGGCAAVKLIGAYENFVSSDAHGISSTRFEGSFPSAYRFYEDSGLGTHCIDMRWDALGFNVAITVILSALLRPSALTLYWCLFLLTYWHISFFSDPRASPPPISDLIGSFWPALAWGYLFWRTTFRHIMPAFERLPIERTIWMLGGLWVGALTNVTFDQVPIDRLVGGDITSRPGALVALIIIIIVVVVLVAFQVLTIRRMGRGVLLKYLLWYIMGGLVILILCLIPGYTFRLHHYIFATLLLPGTATPTRLGLLLSFFLLGMFLNGISRWGFDSILQTAAELQRDAPLGSSLPSLVSNITYSAFTSAAAEQLLRWTPVSDELYASEGWDGFSLIIDDVLRWTGNSSTTSYSLTNNTAGLYTNVGYGSGSSASSVANASGEALEWSGPHFFRLAYTKSGTSGDFTRAMTVWPNGTVVAPESGPS